MSRIKICLFKHSLLIQSHLYPFTLYCPGKDVDLSRLKVTYQRFNDNKVIRKYYEKYKILTKTEIFTITNIE